MSQKFKITGISVDDSKNHYCIKLSDGRAVWGKEFWRDIETSKKKGYDVYGWPAMVEDRVWYHEGASEERFLARKRRGGWLG
jgi:hypothetical protein